jgi:hypothetical protein
MQNSSKLCRLWTSLDQLQFIKYGIKHRSPSWCFVACCPGGINGNLRRVGPCLWHALVRICAYKYVHICGWKGMCVLRVLCVCALILSHIACAWQTKSRSFPLTSQTRACFSWTKKPHMAHPSNHSTWVNSFQEVRSVNQKSTSCKTRIPENPELQCTLQGWAFVQLGVCEHRVNI